MDVIKELREMKNTIANEIAEANDRIRQSGGDMNTADVEIIDKLTHSMKSLATTVAMLEAEEDGGYTRGSDGYSGRDYRGGNYEYSGRYYGPIGRERRNSYGYSRTGNMVDHLRAVMDEAPDENTRMEIKKLMDRMSN